MAPKNNQKNKNQGKEEEEKKKPKQQSLLKNFGFHKKHGSVFYTMKDYDVTVCTEPDGSANLLLKKRERLW